MKFESNKPDTDWLERVRHSPINFTKDRDTRWRNDPTLELLKEKLFALGGYILSYRPDSYTEKVAREGVPLDGKQFRRMPMTLGAAHENVVKVAREHKVTRIWTGWALSEDGCWRSHSWVQVEGVFFETTVPRVGYFGITVPVEEALQW